MSTFMVPLDLSRTAQAMVSPSMTSASSDSYAGSPSSSQPEDDAANEERRKYREKRQKNNLAAKKSRDAKRERERKIRELVEELQKENNELRQALGQCVCRNFKTCLPLHQMEYIRALYPYTSN